MSDKFKIPRDVVKTAKIGNKLVKKGYQGGTQTGWDRGEQLANDKYVDLQTLYQMRTWFARHGPDAKNGGTSYPGYINWVNDGAPKNLKNAGGYRGAVSWLIWGGDAAYLWLKTSEIRKKLNKEFGEIKSSSPKIRIDKNVTLF